MEGLLTATRRRLAVASAAAASAAAATAAATDAAAARDAAVARAATAEATAEAAARAAAGAAEERERAWEAALAEREGVLGVVARERDALRGYVLRYEAEYVLFCVFLIGGGACDSLWGSVWGVGRWGGCTAVGADRLQRGLAGFGLSVGLLCAARIVLAAASSHSPRSRGWWCRLLCLSRRFC